jgi:hypothetical protein
VVRNADPPELAPHQFDISNFQFSFFNAAITFIRLVGSLEQPPAASVS